MIKVFGHISPDTDATVSAILWAWYLNHHTTHEATPFVLGSLNKETQFVLAKWKTEEPALLESITTGDLVTIVDTNNPQELFTNIGEAEVVQIIDHHMLTGGISTRKPIDVTIKPLASTATVIHDLLGSHAESMPEQMTGLMLSSILSDTLAFRSPTTTPHDKAVAEKLAAKLGLDITTYANEMFAAKSDVSDFTDVGLLHIDSKKSALGDKNIRISVVETTDTDSILKRKDGIVDAIKQLVQDEEDVDEVLFFIIDIFKEHATVLTYNQFVKDIISTSFEVAAEGDTEILPGIVSRKKQIIPMLKLPSLN
ncbi:MAG: manganese-dependent inorganic pyrophosphatase [Patescibacteria group bacterium]